MMESDPEEPGLYAKSAGMTEQQWRDLVEMVGPALAKAHVDTFDYLVVLRNGMRLRCQSIDYQGGNWVTLYPDECEPELNGFVQNFGHPCPRGLDVKLSDILAVADAPDGS